MVRVIEHPVVKHKLNLIRDASLQRKDIRKLLKELSCFLIYEALRDFAVYGRKIQTWIGEREFEFVDEGSLVLVPVLRAGIPMLEGGFEVVPDARVGFLALKRDDESLKAHLYYSRLPSLEGRTVIILDPMLATGGTLLKAIEEVKKWAPAETLSVHVVCAPEGLERVRNRYPDHRIFTASVDEKLDPKGYIIPGLGDMGDRLFL